MFISAGYCNGVRQRRNWSKPLAAEELLKITPTPCTHQVGMHCGVHCHLFHCFFGEVFLCEVYIYRACGVQLILLPACMARKLTHALPWPPYDGVGTWPYKYCCIEHKMRYSAMQTVDGGEVFPRPSLNYNENI